MRYSQRCRGIYASRHPGRRGTLSRRITLKETVEEVGPNGASHSNQSGDGMISVVQPDVENRIAQPNGQEIELRIHQCWLKCCKGNGFLSLYGVFPNCLIRTRSYVRTVSGPLE